MEKSIESIWKRGFANQEIMNVPKIQDFSRLKSVYFIDKFKAKYQRNIIGLVIPAVLILVAFILGGIPLTGCYMFTLFITLSAIGQFELIKLNELSLTETNFDFLKKFDKWLKRMLSKFSIIYRFFIPLLFIGFTIGILKTNLSKPFVGETLNERLFSNFESFSIGGIPLLVLICILFLAGLLSYFSNFLFHKEMNVIYGDLTSRINGMLKDLKEIND